MTDHHFLALWPQVPWRSSADGTYAYLKKNGGLRASVNQKAGTSSFHPLHTTCMSSYRSCTVCSGFPNHDFPWQHHSRFGFRTTILAVVMAVIARAAH